MMDKLRKVALFKGFPDEVLGELEPLVGIEKYGAGDLIFSEGTEGDATYIIDEGTIEIRKKEKTVALLSDGAIFGEIALFEEEKRSADAYSKTGSVLYKINSRDFKKFLLEHPDSGARFLLGSIQEMARRLRRTTDYFITVFETGKIVGGDYTISDMTEKILRKLVENIDNATGGMILLMNPFTDMYDVACSLEDISMDYDKAVELIGQGQDKVLHKDGDAFILGVKIEEESRILGYIFIQKKAAGENFTNEQEIIISTVGDQIGLGIINAYNRQEEEARKRLEEGRMKGY